MNQDELKKQVAEAALEYVESGTIIGVGTGSTANHFIDALARIKGKIDGTVASSVASAERLKSHGIPVLDLNEAGELSVYVDGADETNDYLQLIKGDTSPYRTFSGEEAIGILGRLMERKEEQS